MRFAGYIVARVGGYKIIEGIGRNGGQWLASKPGDVAVFATYRAAVEHAEISSGSL